MDEIDDAKFIISIHALRGEGDSIYRRSSSEYILFQSTPSVGRATSPVHTAESFRLFQSTPSVGRATKDGVAIIGATASISIHALRGEGDCFQQPAFQRILYFNPRPPWGGRRKCSIQFSAYKYFNPRPPWGGRLKRNAEMRFHAYFNPRPPWGGRL